MNTLATTSTLRTPDAAAAETMAPTVPNGIKRLIKSLCYGLAFVPVLPLAVPELVLRRIVGHDVLFQSQAQLFSLFPGKSGYFVRNAFYHLTLKRCPLNCCFHFGTVITHSETEIGNYVGTGVGCVIGQASIGDFTMLSEASHIISGQNQHGTEPGIPYQLQRGTYRKVKIGSNVWIGAGALVMADIGDDSIIGAGSVVKRAIPAKKIAVGSPARPVRDVGARTSQAPCSVEEQVF